MRNILILGTLAGGLLFGTACSQKVRSITTDAIWWNGDAVSGFYMGYWEGTCKSFLGCDRGDGKVQWCTLMTDNSLSCAEQAEVSAILATKQKKKK